MINFPMPRESIMGAWIMPEGVIDGIWNFWNKSATQDFKTKGGVHHWDDAKAEYVFLEGETKKSIDMAISPNAFDEPWGTYRKHLQECLNNYIQLYQSANHSERFDINENYNIQFYKKGEGFSKLHHENLGSSMNVYRHLVFMTYCDDVPNGGTHFEYQNLTVPCKKGLTVIWPAGFSHSHKGQITKEHEKMIVTGWYSFSEIYNKLQ